jgi:hypothetical protein
MDRCAEWAQLVIEEWKSFYLNEEVLYEYLRPSDDEYYEIRGNGWVFKEGINKGKLNLFYVKLSTGFDNLSINNRTNIDKIIFKKEVYRPLIGYLVKEKIIKPPYEENLPEYHAAIDFIVGDISSPPIGFYDITPSPQYKKEQEESKRLKELEEQRRVEEEARLRLIEEQIMAGQARLSEEQIMAEEEARLSEEQIMVEEANVARRAEDEARMQPGRQDGGKRRKTKRRDNKRKKRKTKHKRIKKK